MVPLFRLGFGMPAIGATATSLFAIIPTSLSGCVTHLKNKTGIPRLGVATGIAGACTSALGVFCASISPAWLIMLAAALIITYSSFTMLKKAIKMPKERDVSLRSMIEKAKAERRQRAGSTGGSQSASGEQRTLNDRKSFGNQWTFFKRKHTESSASAGADAGASADAGAGVGALVGKVTSTAEESAPLLSESVIETYQRNESEDDRPTLGVKDLAKGFLIGLFAGFASGYVGVGGGFIMVPLFVSVLGISMKYASGTSLIAVTILAIPGAIEQALLGNIDYLAGIAMIVGSIPGALIGATLIRYISERKLRFVFGFFLMVAAVFLVINEFAPTFMA